MNWRFIIRKSVIILIGFLAGFLPIFLGKIVLNTSFLTHLLIDHDLLEHLVIGLR